MMDGIGEPGIREEELGIRDLGRWDDTKQEKDGAKYSQLTIHNSHSRFTIDD
jgi:hypothetical protein